MKFTAELWDKIYKVCNKIADYYGPPFYGPDYPISLVVIDEPKKDWGYWDIGRMYINVNGATWEEIVGTCIHEYAHHQQDPSDWSYDYEAEPERRAKEDLHLFV